jgi:hypothetical protein
VTAPQAQLFVGFFFLLSYPLVIQHAANLHVCGSKDFSTLKNNTGHVNPHGKINNRYSLDHPLVK